jgi:DNA modification methylase
MADPFTTTHQIFLDDARHMSTLPDECVDLVVTSPPYPMIQLWDDQFCETSTAIKTALEKEDAPLAFELMHQQLDMAWSQMFRVLKPGAIACVNIGDATRSMGGQFQLFANHARIISKFLSLGFLQLPSILWRKPTNAPNKFMGSGMLPPGAYVTLEHEFILIFRKGGKRAFAGNIEKQARRESAYFWEERNRWFSDVWMDLRGTPQSMNMNKSRVRSGAFPLELPFRLINMFSVIGDTILDPFLGTGTTVLAAMCCGRDSLGFEIEPAFQHTILEKMAAVAETANTVIRQRLIAHQEFVQERIEANMTPRHHNHFYDLPVVTRQEKDLWLHPVQHVHYLSAQKARVIYGSRNRMAESPALCPPDQASSETPPFLPPAKGRQLKLF